MALLTPDKIRTEHGLVIKEKIIPWGAVWPKNYGKYKKGSRYKADRLLSGGTGKVQHVTIHNTNDIEEAKGTNDAEQYTRSCWPNANLGDVRVHYFIDETDCWQNLREDEVGAHAADGTYGPGNDTSLAIEIIMDGSGSAADKAAEDRGALLAAILLNRHGLGIDRLTTHNRWYKKKYCPAYILPHWDEFKAKVEKYLQEIQGTAKTEPPKQETVPAAKPAGGYSLEQFVREVQAVTGAAVDGIAGPETISKTPTLSATINRKHAAVKAVQKRLTALGYSQVGKVDGIAGPKFTAAVKAFQKDQGCVVDGEITARNKTWRKLLGMK